MNPKKNNFKSIFVGIFFTVIIILSGLYFWSNNKAPQIIPENKNQTTVVDLSTTTVATVTPIVQKEEIKEKPLEPEAFSYSIAGLPVTVTKSTEVFGYTASKLESMAEDCQTAQETNYFSNLVAKFKNTNKIVYSFKYQGDGQADDTFLVTILPNKAGYFSIDQFKMGFNLCEAGGLAYPEMLNKNWLLFVSSCGSGFEDGSDKVHGCEEIQKIVEPSLKLN